MPLRRVVCLVLAAALALPQELLAGAGRSTPAPRGVNLSLGAPSKGLSAGLVPSALAPFSASAIPTLAGVSVPSVGAPGAGLPARSGAMPSVSEVPASRAQVPLIQRLAEQAPRLEKLAGPQAGDSSPETSAQEARRLMDLSGEQTPGPGESAARPPSGGSPAPAGPSKPGSPVQPPRRPKQARLAPVMQALGRFTGYNAFAMLFGYGRVERYVDELLDTTRPAAERAQAARHLARLNRPETLEALGAAGADADAQVREAARQALAVLGSKWSKKFMREAALHPLRAGRISALRALGALARFDSSPAYIDVLGNSASVDADTDVRLVAIEALTTAISPRALAMLREARATARPAQISALEIAIPQVERRLAAAGRPFAKTQAPDEGEFGRSKSPLQYGALKRVVGVAAVFTLVELIGSAITGSLSLKADAMHMTSDLVVNVGALFAILMGRRPPNSRRTYGYLKMESLIGLASAGLIAFIGLHTGVEALQRLGQPSVVPGLLTMALAGAGLLANVIATLLLYRYREESLSLKGAFLHSASDALGSLGIIVAGLLIWAFGWFIADPIISMLIVGLILHTTYDLAKRSWSVLIDAVPPGIKIDEIEADLLAVPGVASVHDLHVRSLNSSVLDATIAVYVKPGSAHPAVLRAIKEALKRRGIEHSTIQIEALAP